MDIAMVGNVFRQAWRILKGNFLLMIGYSAVAAGLLLVARVESLEFLNSRVVHTVMAQVQSIWGGHADAAVAWKNMALALLMMALLFYLFVNFLWMIARLHGKKSCSLVDFFKPHEHYLVCAVIVVLFSASWLAIHHVGDFLMAMQAAHAHDAHYHVGLMHLYAACRLFVQAYVTCVFYLALVAVVDSGASLGKALKSSIVMFHRHLVTALVMLVVIFLYRTAMAALIVQVKKMALPGDVAASSMFMSIFEVIWRLDWGKMYEPAVFAALFGIVLLVSVPSYLLGVCAYKELQKA